MSVQIGTNIFDNPTEITCSLYVSNIFFEFTMISKRYNETLQILNINVKLRSVHFIIIVILSCKRNGISSRPDIYRVYEKVGAKLILRVSEVK